MWPFNLKSPEVERRLSWIEYDIWSLTTLVQQVLELERKQMADLSRLTASVAELPSVVDSVLTLLTGIAEQLRNAGTDQAAIDAIADQIDAEKAKMAAAVAANTPSA